MSGSWPQADFPKLNTGNCKITSEATGRYNCIAWAAGTDKRWWDPNGIYYWPANVPREVSIDAFFQVYEGLGYSTCIGGDLEPGFEKIAIYARQVEHRKIPTHAARQLDDGTWTSKLGRCEDTCHTEAHLVTGPGYGDIIYFMSRPKPTPTD